jgi:hypothetical protein
MQDQQPQRENQDVNIFSEYNPYAKRPLSPIIEEATAELAHNKKRSRESPTTIYDTSEDDRELKRRQTLDSRDTAEATAADDEASYVEVSREEAGSRAESYEDASTQVASPLERFYGEAGYGEADGEDAADEEAIQDESYSDSPSPSSGFDREHSLSPIPEPDSNFFILPKDRWPKEHKSAQYRDPSWIAGFTMHKTFLCEFPEGLAEGSVGLCKELLEREQSPPEISLFDDEVIHETCIRVQRRNETMIFRDITPLIAPSAEILASRGEEQLDILCESTNEIWTYSQPLLRNQPQPTYSVGFKALAFTELQFTRVTEFFEARCCTQTSPIMGSSNMFFPCFSCEIGPLEIAQRQNVHNMTIGMRAVVELFRGVNREAELHRQVLAFSISHDHSQAQIVAHYPIILGDSTEYYQKVISSFNFLEVGYGDRWLAYRFTKNMYEVWMPAQFNWICSAINQLPDGYSCGQDIGQREFV